MLALGRPRPYLLLCLVPWLVPLYYRLNYQLHPEPDYVFAAKIAVLAALWIACAGLVIAVVRMKEAPSFLGIIGVCSAVGYLVWFPWEFVPEILTLR